MAFLLLLMPRVLHGKANAPRQATPLGQIENVWPVSTCLADAQIGRALGMNPAPVSIEQLASFLFKKEEGERSPRNVSGGCVACRFSLFCLASVVPPLHWVAFVSRRCWWLCVLAVVQRGIALGGIGPLEPRSF